MKAVVIASITFMITLTSFRLVEGGPSVSGNTPSVISINDVDRIYAEISGQKPSRDVFINCLKGYLQLRSSGQDDWNDQLITIIDFRLSSNRKRLWVIDLNKKEVVFHTLVAHGRNSGDEFAEQFSNIPSSYQSSLGFYLTGGTYTGKHGLSLYLDGMEKGYNDNARERAIVMHGADYVSPDFIRKHGRLGRSFGCPSVPMSLHRELINTIKDKTCLFIFYPDRNYIQSSELLNASL